MQSIGNIGSSIAVEIAFVECQIKKYGLNLKIDYLHKITMATKFFPYSF